jgi:hypothetical protein
MADRIRRVCPDLPVETLWRRMRKEGQMQMLQSCSAFSTKRRPLPSLCCLTFTSVRGRSCPQSCIISFLAIIEPFLPMSLSFPDMLLLDRDEPCKSRAAIWSSVTSASTIASMQVYPSRAGIVL